MEKSFQVARRSIAALQEDFFEGVRGGLEKGNRESAVEREKSEEEIKQIRTVSGTNGTLARLKLFPGNGAAKVVEEGTGTECLKCRYDGLIVMSVATEGRTRAEGPIEFFGLGLLHRQAIMESEDGDPLVVKVRQNDG